jgi:cysteinyl-tRNA synthetase
VDFSDDALWEAKRALDRFYGLFQRLDESSGAAGPGDRLLPPLLERMGEGFRQAMDDDFSTPGAIAQFQLLRGELNRLIDAGLSRRSAQQAREHLRSFGQVLSLFQSSWREWEYEGEAAGAAALADEEIERKLAERNEARRRKDFARADEIRAELASLGIIIEDRPDGTSRWKR